MGIAGVAWATFICQGISAVLAVIVVFLRLSKIKVLQRCPVFSFIILVKLLKIAIPSILQQSFISIGNIIIQSVINEFQDAEKYLPDITAAVQLNNLVVTFHFTTLANGTS